MPKPRPPCDQCEGTEDVREYYAPYSKHPTYQCDNCAEAAWERHCTDYDAPTSQERYEQAHKAKRMTR